MFLIPLMVSAAFSMLVIAAQIAALDPLMVTRASTSMVFFLGSGCCSMVMSYLPNARRQRQATRNDLIEHDARREGAPSGRCT
jgi:hypothetical protein